MNNAIQVMIILSGIAFSIPCHADVSSPLPTQQAVDFPKEYRNFRLISVSQRGDDQSLRAILGNDIAIEAARLGKPHPWPDGSIFAKVVWHQKPSENFPAATVPGEFSSVAVMVKAANSYADTGGWGFGEWSGTGLKPYDKPGFAQECFACHEKVKSQDWVFTRPLTWP